METNGVQESGRTRRMASRVFLSMAVGGAVLVVSVFVLLSYEAEHSRGGSVEEVIITFGKGESISRLAKDLKGQGIIRYETPFFYYLWREGSWKNLQAGDYLLSGDLSIPGIAGKIIRGETVQKGIKVTLPEGWTAAEMAARLSENGLPGDEFLALVKNPKTEWRTEYPFLANLPENATLEGVLFPDTYFFDPRGGAEKIILKMLKGFETKAIPILSGKQGKEWYDTLTLSSIIEAEVRTEDDRRMVADIFFRRLGIGQALQSDATVRYALGVIKIQHSAEDIAIDSPYNTYKHPGLPTGPISNPGVISFQAAVDPTANAYWYFLNNPQTGETVFSQTFDEHIQNKIRNGL